MKNNIQNNYEKYAGNAGVKSRIPCYDQEIKQQSLLTYSMEQSPS